ncbi:MAG: benzoate-CoA ligase family protein [Actinomycetota bacterium]|nr:benzoate-CoA ligase family protein [Actinomycetota bacterium]
MSQHVDGQYGGTPRFNAAEYLLDRHVEAGQGERVAVRCEGRDLSYTALRDLTVRVAAGLRALGLRREERVLFCMGDTPELLAGILGAFRAGIVAVPASTMLTGVELGKILADSGARALFLSPQFAEAGALAAAAAPELTDVVVTGEGSGLALPAGCTLTGWDDFLAAGQEQYGDCLPVADTVGDFPALWLYTSGTTGLPKAAMHRHANIRHVSETYARHVLGITADDRCLSVAKLFFAYGIGNSAFFPLSVGATTILEPRRPTPEVIAERLGADRPTLFFGVPTFFAALLTADVPAELFSSVRLCGSAGEALPAALYARFTSRYGVEVLDGIGSTEALHIFLSNAPGDVTPGTTGRPVPGYEVELRDETGARVPPGTPGSLFVKGESIATGYWCRTATTRQLFQGEWLSTGDTYVEDENGRFASLGRSDEMLKAGGIWVSPLEVEERLLQHPAVAEAGVVGLPDSEGLDKPVACVVLVPGASVTGDELVAFCREGLAAFKLPRSVLLVDELPRTATGKLQRFRVRSLAQEALT